MGHWSVTARDDKVFNEVCSDMRLDGVRMSKRKRVNAGGQEFQYGVGEWEGAWCLMDDGEGKE